MVLPKVSADILVIGAGLVGSSVALHVAQKTGARVRVLDFDLEGTLSSSELNAGGVRATWTQPVNIEASKLSIEYFSKNFDQVGYRACGYLWLHGQSKWAGALKVREIQNSAGWPVEVWDVAELKRRVPFIDKADDIAGAVFGVRDGLVNPNLLKNHFRSLARAAGVIFEDRVWVRAAQYGALEGARQGVTVKGYRFPQVLDTELKIAVLSGKFEGFADEVSFAADLVINCAGAWAPGIAEILGYPCPSHALRRQICMFDSREVDLTPYGMIVDTSGVYFHPEASNGLAGFADPNESAGINFEYDGEDYFMNMIWPALYERSTGFEKLRHVTGWSGLYEVSPDETAILGKVELGQAGRAGCVYEAHSYSGHGAMHSYAAGVALAELIGQGRFQTWDASPLSARRFETGRLIKETLVI